MGFLHLINLIYNKMKHSIINELYTCKKVLSVLEEEKGVLIEIETLSNIDDRFISSDSISISKEKLHSFIGTLLHVQARLKGGKKNG